VAYRDPLQLPKTLSPQKHLSRFLFLITKELRALYKNNGPPSRSPLEPASDILAVFRLKTWCEKLFERKENHESLQGFNGCLGSDLAFLMLTTWRRD
jgi:hypothetical protein